MINVFDHAVMITGFVFEMMLLIEYVNVLTSGAWQGALTRNRWGQYGLAALLGATPGCLGAFVVVSMYSHGAVTMGAVVAAMIATTGDEAYVMLAMIPGQALYLTLALAALGIAAGALTDLIPWRRDGGSRCTGLEVHDSSECRCVSHGQILQQWRELSPVRGILMGVLALFTIAIASGQVGPVTWNWVRTTILFLTVLSLLIVSTVPEHFLQEHLWGHVARRHLPRIFLWTLGALVAMQVLTEHLDLQATIEGNLWVVLVVACLVGVIPESGPHLVFVTLYAQGAVPLSILLASSIVQDGHGMLPMLAHSRKGFVQVKAINLIAGLVVGTAGLLVGI